MDYLAGNVQLVIAIFENYHLIYYLIYYLINYLINYLIY